MLWSFGVGEQDKTKRKVSMQTRVVLHQIHQTTLETFRCLCVCTCVCWLAWMRVHVEAKGQYQVLSSVVFHHIHFEA